MLFFISLLLPAYLSVSQGQTEGHRWWHSPTFLLAIVCSGCVLEGPVVAMGTALGSAADALAHVLHRH